MGVVLTKHVADNAGAFAIGTIRGEPQLLHGKQDAALHGLKAVAHIGKGPPHDHAHGVFEVGTLHLLMQGDRLDSLPVLLLGHPLLVSEGRSALSLQILARLAGARPWATYWSSWLSLLPLALARARSRLALSSLRCSSWRVAARSRGPQSCSFWYFSSA